MSSPLWTIVQDWYDRQQVKPTWAKVAEALGVSQSTFDTWKKPAEMPRRRTLWAIHELTRAPFKTVVDAAIESAELYNAERAREAHEAHRLKKARSGDVDSDAAQKMTEDGATVHQFPVADEVTEGDEPPGLSEPDETLKPAADDVNEDDDEEPGGSDDHE